MTMDDFSGAELVHVPTGFVGGRLVDLSGRQPLEGIEIALSARRESGEVVRVVGRTDAEGTFMLEVPAGPFIAAAALADVMGATPIDIELEAGEIESGEVVFVVGGDSVATRGY